MKQTTKSILVPLDFSKQSIIALEQTYNLARLTKSEITLLHVVRHNNSIFGLFSESEQKEMRIRLKNKLETFAQKSSIKAQVPINTIISEGKVVDQIIETAEHIDAQSIIMGTHRPENMMKRVIGSTALRVIKEASCPVISIVGEYHREGCSNIVLPLDLKKGVNQKVNETINFAKLCKATVHVVSVAPDNDPNLTDRYKLGLKGVKTVIEKQNINCTTKILKANGNNETIAKKVLDYSIDIKGDLIIIMTQQENEIAKYFLGSFAKEIIHKSSIPVMSIVPKKI